MLNKGQAVASSTPFGENLSVWRVFIGHDAGNAQKRFPGRLYRFMAQVLYALGQCSHENWQGIGQIHLRNGIWIIKRLFEPETVICWPAGM